MCVGGLALKKYKSEESRLGAKSKKSSDQSVVFYLCLVDRLIFADYFSDSLFDGNVLRDLLIFEAG